MANLDLIVVEENPNHLEEFRSSLADSTLSVQYFTDGEETLNKLEEIRPKVLVISLEMDSVSVEDFLIRFSQKCIWDNMAVIIASNQDIPKKDFFSLASLGASDTLKKSIDRVEFLEKLNHFKSAA
ncbi:MAG: response regulator [Bdellovibrionota bacterium]